MSTNNSGFHLSNKPVFKFLPVLLMMLAIFLFSASPSDNLPSNFLSKFIYKSGHVIGYAMLAISIWRAFSFKSNWIWFAWFLAVLYAVTDEYHQSFVPGRKAAVFDVLVYDNIGALISLWLASMFMKQKQPMDESLVVEEKTLSTDQ